MVLNFIKSSYQKVKNALSKTHSLLGNKIRTLFSGQVNEEMLEQLEQILYEADLGIKTSTELTEKTRQLLKTNPQLKQDEILDFIRNQLLNTIAHYPSEFGVNQENGPLVVLVVGVNGNGKTTTVAKLAKLFRDSDKTVLIAGADTFRAAATEQLETWAHRLGVEIVKGNEKSDPAAVTFDAITAAKSRKIDVVIVDTAGRLHTKTNLMQELEKIRRTCNKVSPGSPHETLLVLDATTGQNAIDQAQTFNKFTPITGLVLTKLDGSAKGGVVISITQQVKIPVKFIGVGEGIEDLEVFRPESFIQMLFE